MMIDAFLLAFAATAGIICAGLAVLGVVVLAIIVVNR